MVSINRVAMNQSAREILRRIQPETLDAGEISGRWGRSKPFKSYSNYRYPAFDICKGPLAAPDGTMLTFDIVIAHQVWEHLDRPYKATQNVLKMVRPGGYFYISVPFFVPFHAAPVDNSRWSARGLKNLLIEAGFPESGIEADQWGNRHAAKRNLELPWPPEYNRAVDDLTNDPDMPIVSWALARLPN